MDVLKNKSYKDYSYTSRYESFPFYYNTADNKYIYGTTEWLSNSTAYTLHEIMPYDTLDSIALDAYNNPALYWVIADFNRILDPFEDLPVGEVLKVPVITGVRYVSEVQS